MSEIKLKNKLINELYDFLSRNKLNLKGEQVVLGVSCGVDSMVLLDLFLNLQEKIGYKLNVCHVNHKRRLQSEDEEAFIREYLKDKCPLYVLEFDENENIESNFQEIARLRRLNFFRSTINEVNGKYLVLAHHLNDDIETSFMHLIRSGSLDSIAGIKEINNYKDICILRPLLRVLKDDLYQYAKENDVKFFEDESNSHDDYTRNRIRHNVVSELFKENPSFDSTFINYKERLSYASNLLNDYRDELIKNNVIKAGESYRFSLDWFTKLDKIIVKEILFELLKEKMYSIDNINEIINIINTNKVSFVNEYLGVTIIKEHDEITLTSKKYEKAEINVCINKYKRYYLNSKYDLLVSRCENSDFLQAKSAKNTISNINTLWYNSIRLPLLVRGRCDGDQILLSSGHKKVKDLLIDEHLSSIEKDNVLLLIDNEGDIISVLGIKKSKKIENSPYDYDLKIELIEK